METNTEVQDTIKKGTKKSSTRDTDSRESNQRSYLETDSWLTIPEGILSTFKDQGYHLGWLRVYLNGSEDYKAVGKKINEGWEFVTSDEVPEMTVGYGYSKAEDRFENFLSDIKKQDPVIEKNMPKPLTPPSPNHKGVKRKLDKLK